MDNSVNFWTLPVPGSDATLVAPLDWEGFLLLNPTATWIWHNYSLPNLAYYYAEHFGISEAQAAQDIATVSTGLKQLSHPPATPQQPVLPVELPSFISFTCRLNKSTFLIHFATLEIANEVIPRLAALEALAANHEHIFSICQYAEGISVVRDGIHLAVEPLVTGARVILLQELTRLAAPDRDFTAILHAGAVGDSEKCLILAGASFSGKSTLCVALMQAGLLCYSDDTAALTREFRIAGMPFAISLREGSWPLFPHLDRPRFLPSNLNGTSPEVPPVGLIFVNYDSTAERTSIEAMDTFDALLAIQQSGFWVEHTKPAISTFLSWLSRLPIYRLTYSDLDSAVAMVRSKLSVNREHLA